jgi:phospholipid/cholesterol/gamma-HCH transport system substrate-binding protein
MSRLPSIQRMTAIAAGVGVLVVAALVVLLTGVARSSSGGTYKVRAIFDDASYAVTGEDVRVAGANVGSITALGVTSGKKAAVTMSITDSDFTPFHANAHCTIRPQSLIGEEYVDCTPGSSHQARLPLIRKGPGTGSYYLPVTRTSSPIDTDIVQDISTEPVQESLAVIINEFGTGLAARGSDLNAVIHRADPALGNTDKVLRILARQDKTLAQLATNSQTVLAPLARERAKIAGFVKNANTTAVASAQQSQAISETFHKFPSFLHQLRPLMADLGSLADEGTPVANELSSSAGSLSNEFAQLTPFANSARTALTKLGAAAKQAQPELVATEPLARRLAKLGAEAKPASRSAATLLDSLNTTGGIEQLMNVLYEGVSAGNGYDSLGHYVRAEPLVSTCTNYTTVRNGACDANFPGSKATVASSTKPSKGSTTSAVQTAATAQATATDARKASAIVSEALKSVSGSGTSDSTMGGLLDYLLGHGSSR